MMLHTLEAKFVFTAGKVHLSANDVEFLPIALTQSRIKWEEIMTKAYYHDCMPMLYWCLKGIHNVRFPKRVLTELKKSYLYAFLRNSHCLKQVADLNK